MKKIILSLIIICNIVSAQQGNYLDFLPLQVGNIWVYNCISSGAYCYCYKKYRIKVAGNVILNNKFYYVFQKSQFDVNCLLGGCNAAMLPFDTLRVDSTTGNILKYADTNFCTNTPFEIMYDSLNAKLHDTVWNYCGASMWRYQCTDTTPKNVLGSLRRIKEFRESQFESGYGRFFANGIGMHISYFVSLACNSSLNLIGCVIGGIVYGDTGFMVGINQISSEIPESFSLYQNYPNPFNPVTSIKFEIPNLSSSSSIGDSKSETNSKTEIRIYDVLGREIAILVNEPLSPGTYEVEFDGTNYASGIYYYTLSAGDPSAPLRMTKKMVLIK
jgi:hypothetical protein